MAQRTANVSVLPSSYCTSNETIWLSISNRNSCPKQPLTWTRSCSRLAESSYVMSHFQLPSISRLPISALYYLTSKSINQLWSAL